MQVIRKKTTWIDIFKPNQNDIDSLKRLHAFHPLILEELLHPSARGHVENHKTYLFMVLHIPVYDPTTRTSRRAEIDFLITKSALVTVRYEALEQVDMVLNALARDEKLQKEILSGSSLLPLHRILEEIMNFSLRQMRHIEEQVSVIAQEIFHHKEGELLEQISYVKRNILDYRLIMRPHETLFDSLRTNGKQFWGEASSVYLTDLQGDNLRLLHNLENYFQVIESLELTNSQLLNAQTNLIIKRFTILAFLFTIPLFFVFSQSIPHVAGIFLTSPLRFWLSFTLVFVLVGWLAYVFKKRKMF